MLAEGIHAMTTVAAYLALQERAEWHHGRIYSLVPIALFGMIALIVWFGTRVARTAIHEQAELRKKLIEKFGSGQELAAFLESEGGRQFLAESRGAGSHSGGGPHRFFIPGVILTGLGGAFFALGHNFLIPAVIVLALGICFIVLAVMFRKCGAKGCCGTDSRTGMAS